MNLNVPLRKENMSMKQKRVWLVSGIPGSGKSTWIQQQIAEKGGVWCSRDNIRFSLLSGDEGYFDHEQEVLCKWYDMINDAMSNPEVEDIYIDATNLTDRTRRNVINQIYSDDFALCHVVFDVPLPVCLERNNKRSGRAKVPESAIHQMYSSFKFPSFGKMIIIDENGKEKTNE